MSNLQGSEMTKEDVSRLERHESKAHPDGKIPAGSTAAAMQSLVDKENKSKPELIEERRANLPLPDLPPTAPDWNSADARTVNVGSGSLSGGGDGALREPATGESAVRADGDALKTHTQGTEVGREKGGVAGDAVAK